MIGKDKKIRKGQNIRLIHMKQLKSHDSTTPVNCQDEGGKFLMSEALKE